MTHRHDQHVDRRSVLKGAAAFAGVAAAGGFARIEMASASTIEVPVVDSLHIRVLLDSAHDIFLSGQEVNGVTAERAAPASDYRQTLHNQWGLSLQLQTQIADERRVSLLDFGYSPDALLNNIDILGVEPAEISSLIVSHGHFDHYGGLIGFLEAYRDVLPADLKLYAGGEENFCQRFSRTPVEGQFTDFGLLDRPAIEDQRVAIILAEEPTVIEGGHIFTTGAIKRRSFEEVLPNTMVSYERSAGLGCDASHFTAAELDGEVVPDEHHHEHATVINVKDRGLVVISSCGHAGIINTLRQAQEVSGVEKIHALVGGFHLAPARPDYLHEAIDGLEELDPDVVIPMHCSGINFVEAMRERLPDKLVLSTTGTLFTFGA